MVSLLLLSASFAYFAGQVEQAKADMGIGEPSVVRSTYIGVRDVRGRTVIAWTDRQTFSLPEQQFVEGYSVNVWIPWMEKASKKDLRLTAYHEVCHMLSDGELILSGRLPSQEESRLIEPERDRCAVIWVEAKKAEAKAAAKAKKQKTAGAAVHRKGLWATLGLILLILP